MATASSIFSKPPTGIPSNDEIVALCHKAGYKKDGIPYADSSGAVLAWIKYGFNVGMDEAFTQGWVATYLDAHPEADIKVAHVFATFTSPHPASTIGYIVMEHINAPDCDDSHHEQVAKAVAALLRIEAPNDVPGHYGGGAVVHSLFFEWESEIKYESKEELENHLNGVSEH